MTDARGTLVMPERKAGLSPDVTAWAAWIPSGKVRRILAEAPCKRRSCGHHPGDHGAGGCLPTPEALVVAAHGGPIPDPLPELRPCSCAGYLA